MFIDLTAVYDTVNHLLLDKLYKITKDYYLMKVNESMNNNRRFHKRLQDQKSRWKILENGLPQDMFSHQYFLMYTQITKII